MLASMALLLAGAAPAQDGLHLPWFSEEATVIERYEGDGSMPSYEMEYRLIYLASSDKSHGVLAMGEVKTRKLDGKPWREKQGDGLVVLQPHLRVERDGSTSVHEEAEEREMLTQAGRRMAEDADGAALGRAMSDPATQDVWMRAAGVRFCQWMCAALSAPRKVGVHRESAQTTADFGADLPAVREVWQENDAKQPLNRFVTTAVTTVRLTSADGLPPAIALMAAPVPLNDSAYAVRHTIAGEDEPLLFTLRSTTVLDRAKMLPLSVEVDVRTGAGAFSPMVSYEFQWEADQRAKEHQPADLLPKAYDPEATTAEGKRNASVFRIAPPRYAPVAIIWEGQGDSHVRVRVSPQGDVLDAELDESSGWTPLDLEAVKGVKHWKFHPALQANKPVEATITVPVSFRL